jgi:hypothetical protein
VLGLLVVAALSVLVGLHVFVLDFVFLLVMAALNVLVGLHVVDFLFCSVYWLWLP